MNKVIKVLKVVVKVLTIVQLIRGRKSAKRMLKHKGKKSAFNAVRKLLKK
ncbi:hypothetical protein [Priestia taiwanensis]|uniref:Uncharacterized protein n=1 Tax=Priestia taiwanensis TaxID=1347902 RepID=A0A917EPT6_9BACI|nr:hypothetical protein [Priestia taiwanensis]MBM7364226.1 hypothetical protein [Priestia taiwanensis]GGE72673.1 hypothetical protein GCM10007140_23240 [Priestia taiwanensis]